MIISSALRLVTPAVAALLLSACTSAAPSGPPDAGTVTLTPEVDTFNAVTVGTAFAATTVRGANPAVRITVPQEVQDRVVARTQDKRLEISLSDGAGAVGEQILQATITVAQPLQAVTAREAASVDATASGSLGRDVQLAAASAATITATLNASSVTADVSEGATVLVTGQTDAVSARAQSGSTYRGYDLQAREATAMAESGSTIEVTAMATLSAKATAGSTITYRGSPQTSIDSDITSTVEPG